MALSRWLVPFVLFLASCDTDDSCRRPLDKAPGCEDTCLTRAGLLADLVDDSCDISSITTCTNDNGTYEVIRGDEVRWYLLDNEIVSVEDRGSLVDCSTVGSQWFGSPVLACQGSDLPAALPGCAE
jgi:hypothetical protein